MTLATGARLGPYQIVTLLGAGGMGEVYKARDTRLDRDVAIKVLPAGSIGDANAEARFDREARAIAALNHPNICALYDVGHEDGRSFLVMELLEGETLHQRLARGPFAVAALVEAAIALTDALDTAHTRGVMHRDLKPGNIFLTSRGQPKILDFGLARAIVPAEAGTRIADAPLTGEGVTVGTVAYMSPEQLRGEVVDSRSDLFSLGLVLYEMATGTRAFEGSTNAVVSAAILGGAPVPPREIRPELPLKLEETILKALEKDRDVRCQSAAELRADLKRIARTLGPESPRIVAAAAGGRPDIPSPAPTSAAQSDPVAPSATGPAQSAPPSSDRQLMVGLVRRHRLGAALALVTIAGLVTAAIWFGRRPAPTPPAPESVSPSTLDMHPLTQTGNAGLGMLSADGRFVAYVQTDGPDAGVWVRVLATGGARRIAAHVPGRRYHALAVTPDDSYVDVVARDTTRAWDIWRVPFLGDALPRRIATGLWSAVGWSPDGRRMAFLRDQGYTLVVAEADGSGERMLVKERKQAKFNSEYTSGRNISRPSWSPDGTRLLVIGRSLAPERATRRNHYELVIVDATTGAELAITPFRDVYLTDAAWLDESHALVNYLPMSRRTAASFARLGVADLRTGAVMPVTQDLTNFDGVSLTADRRAAVSTRIDNRSGIWVGSDISNLAEAVPETSAVPRSLSFDDAGDLVYAAESANGTGVYLLRRGEPTPQLVVDDGDQPQVTSDGRIVVFMRAGDRPGVCRVSIDGSGTTTLVEGRVDGVSLAKDDRTVFFERGYGSEQRQWAIPLSGGTPRELSQRWAAASPAQVSPDGRQLLFGGRAKDEHPVAVLCDLPECTNQKELVLPSIAWAPHERSVLYRDPTDPSAVWAQPLTGGAPHLLMKFPFKNMVGAAWSPNGKFMAAVRQTMVSDVVLIKGFADSKPR